MLLYGKMEHNYHLSNKKALFWNMSQYYKTIGRDPFENLPLTFHIENGLGDREFANFRKYYNKIRDEIAEKRVELQKKINAGRQRGNSIGSETIDSF